VTPLTDGPHLVRLRKVRAGECSETPLAFAAIEGILLASEVKSYVSAAKSRRIAGIRRHFQTAAEKLIGDRTGQSRFGRSYRKTISEARPSEESNWILPVMPVSVGLIRTISVASPWPSKMAGNSTV
jgi:hypothetical protein